MLLYFFMLLASRQVSDNLKISPQFPLVSNGQSGSLAYGHPLFPTTIDAPQRFGNEAYGGWDPGQSTLQADIKHIAIGISTASQWWGPATEYPYLLGNNAAGFPHFFLGTSHPFNLRIAKVHSRAIWGALSQSPYSPVTGSEYYVDDIESGRKRFATGVAIAFTPWFSENLELGAARFYHLAWPATGIPRRYYLKPLDAFLKGGVQNGLPANQLASMWFRWVLPNSGFEFYGEYGRDDYNVDLKDFYAEPDHDRSYNVGFRKVSGSPDKRMNVFRSEWFNGQLSQLDIHRAENSRYTHTPLRQGHTSKGQLLGSPVGVGSGAGTTVAYDTYTKGGRWSFTIRRLVTLQTGDFHADSSTSSYNDTILPSAEIENSRAIGPIDLLSSVGIVIPTKNFYRNASPNTRVVLGIKYRY